jgi:hypothetical protein
VISKRQLEWLTMKKVLIYVIFVIGVVSCHLGCKNIIAHKLESNERWDALNYLKTLKVQGRLPGFHADDRGQVTFGASEILLGTKMKYPLKVNFFIQKKDEQQLYIYEVSKDAPDASWILSKAWEKSSQQGTVSLITEGAKGSP